MSTFLKYHGGNALVLFGIIAISSRFSPSITATAVGAWLGCWFCGSQTYLKFENRIKRDIKNALINACSPKE
jgi:hypothetical protein